MRKTILFLFLPLAMLARSQGVKEYRYWLDGQDHEATRVEQTGEEILFHLDADTLNDGIHSFYLMVKDSADKWSSPVSRYFVRSWDNPQQGNAVTYSYWLDNETATRQTATSGNGIIQLNLDLASAPVGIHTLCLEAMDEGGRKENRHLVRRHPAAGPGCLGAEERAEHAVLPGPRCRWQTQCGTLGIRGGAGQGFHHHRLHLLVQRLRRQRTGGGGTGKSLPAGSTAANGQLPCPCGTVHL